MGLSIVWPAANRGPAPRAGAFAALQAGGREARPGPQLFLWTRRPQLQDQGGRAWARGQETQAGMDQTLRSFYIFLSGLISKGISFFFYGHYFFCADFKNCWSIEFTRFCLSNKRQGSLHKLEFMCSLRSRWANFIDQGRPFDIFVSAETLQQSRFKWYITRMAVGLITNYNVPFL